MSQSVDSNASSTDHEPISYRQNYRAAQALVQAFISQILGGCEGPVCKTPTCLTFKLQYPIDQPHPTILTAQFQAHVLASKPNARQLLCPNPPKVPWEELRVRITSDGQRYDLRSISQSLMSSPSVKLFNTSRIDANDENVIPVAPLPEPQEIDWIYWRRKITPTLSPPEWFGDGSQSSRPSFITNRDAAEIFKTCIVSLNECTEFKSERATNTVVLLLRAMARRHAFDEAGLALRQGTMGVSIRTILFHWFRASLVETIHPLNSDRTQEVRNRARSARTSLIEGPQYRDALGSVHYWCDWLKSIIIVNWDGKAVVNRWDIAGAALEQLDLTYQIFRFPEFQWLQARITFDDILQFLDQFRGLSTNPNYRHILQYHGLHHISYFEVVFRAGNASQALTNYYQNEKYVYGYISKLRGILTEPLVKNVLQCFKSSSEPLLNINIRRTSMLKDTFQQFWGRDSHELHKPVKVTYVSETGADQGGLTNDLFRRVFDEASNMNGIFQCLDDSNMYWFQPKSTVPPEFYESLGIIMAVAIFNGIPAPIEFPKVFYFSVIEKHATVHADADPLLSDGWPGQMTHLFRSNLNELGLDFSYSFKGGDGQIWSLDMMTARSIDDAVLGSVESEDVTSLNQDQYRVLYQEWTWKLSVLPQLNAFIKGFNTIFPAKDLNWMSPSMLQHIVSGNAVSVEELKERTEYGTFNAFIYDPTHPVITMFWETLGSFSGEQFKQFLRFVFANEKLPRLSGRWMTIVPYLSNESLPSASTCATTLNLPPYETQVQMKSKLLLAISETEGFHIV